MKATSLLVLGAALVATAALAGDQPRTMLVGSHDWLQSDTCSVADTVTVPDEFGFEITDQCALERHMKEQLRKGPVDLGPAPARGI
ncbi:hypothetical protein JNK62_00510 [bacterium]|nr:hypothetical protein [bacterium]